MNTYRVAVNGQPRTVAAPNKGAALARACIAHALDPAALAEDDRRHRLKRARLDAALVGSERRTAWSNARFARDVIAAIKRLHPSAADTPARVERQRQAHARALATLAASRPALP